MPPPLDWRDQRAAIIVAHPDDETIGLGGQLARLRDPLLVQVTDGAPRSIGSGRAEHARTRSAELAAALQAGDAHSVDYRQLGIVDQEASLNMPLIVACLVEQLAARRPEVILTHPYEGGHPDHDATAFAVHAAIHAMKRQNLAAPVIWEFTSYHAGLAGGMITGEFLPARVSPETRIVLTGEARRRKLAMIRCFASQHDVLRTFPLDSELFRPAPAYDFAAPPHVGELFYERFEWGMTGERWRRLASEFTL